jgi:hypothetical protein
MRPCRQPADPSSQAPSPAPRAPIGAAGTGRAGAADQSTFAATASISIFNSDRASPATTIKVAPVRTHDPVANGDKRLQVRPVGEIDVETDHVGEVHARRVQHLPEPFERDLRLLRCRLRRGAVGPGAGLAVGEQQPGAGWHLDPGATLLE